MIGKFSLLIFPLLKTSERTTLGGICLRSTDDTVGLSAEEARAVEEVSSMLFLQDDLRIASATYAIIPHLNLEQSASHETAQLQNIQAAIAFLYTSPHEIFGSPFLHSEHASAVIFSPAEISIYLVRPEHHVTPTSEAPFAADERGFVRGYSGLYNFKHHFWVAEGSRVYGPLPHPVLNIAQNLHRDLQQASSRPEYDLLFRLLNSPRSVTGVRILTALRWYSSAHQQSTDELAGIVHLAISLETLLGLPQTEKTDRLVDSISLLLGRVPRIDTWAHQFYSARSRIVHEGYAEDTRFIAGAGSKREDPQIYQSLFSYGTQVFRLCLGTLLFGHDLAERAGLEERFVTNQERYTKLCQLLSDHEMTPISRLEAAVDLVEAIERYRFVGESGLRIETMVGAVRQGAKTLLQAGIPLEPEVSTAVTAVARSSRSHDIYLELDMLRQFNEALSETPNAGSSNVNDVLHRLAETVWGTVFMHYYWMKKQREPAEDVG